jgi:hypothetical protein
MVSWCHPKKVLQHPSNGCVGCMHDGIVNQTSYVLATEYSEYYNEYRSANRG